MGRYTQRRRAASGPSPAAAPPPALPAIATVTNVDGNTARVVFDSPVSIDDVTPPDGNFDINFSAPMTVTIVDGSTVDVFFFAGISSGATWHLAGQPNWILTAVDWPASGIVL